MRFTLALIVALGGCSFVAIHSPDRPGVRCASPQSGPPSRALPIADSVAAAAALSAGGYQYAVQSRTSPFPLAMVVVGAWATASAIYGFTENARCRAALAEPAPGPTVTAP